jgi:hypothetical protein
MQLLFLSASVHEPDGDQLINSAVPVLRILFSDVQRDLGRAGGVGEADEYEWIQFIKETYPDTPVIVEGAPLAPAGPIRSPGVVEQVELPERRGEWLLEVCDTFFESRDAPLTVKRSPSLQTDFMFRNDKPFWTQTANNAGLRAQLLGNYTCHFSLHDMHCRMLMEQCFPDLVHSNDDSHVDIVQPKIGGFLGSLGVISTPAAKVDSTNFQREADVKAVRRGTLASSTRINIASSSAKTLERLELQPLLLLPGAHPWLWIQEGGSVTPLHHDFQDNVYLLITGLKKFTLLSPAAHARLYMYPHSHPAARSSQLKMNFTTRLRDNARFPLAYEFDVLEAVLTPSDMLFLPALWFHHVETVQSSVAINVWTAIQANLYLQEAFMVVISSTAFENNEAGVNVPLQQARLVVLLRALEIQLGELVELEKLLNTLLVSRFAYMHDPGSVDAILSEQSVTMLDSRDENALQDLAVLVAAKLTPLGDCFPENSASAKAKTETLLLNFIEMVVCDVVSPAQLLATLQFLQQQI